MSGTGDELEKFFDKQKENPECKIDLDDLQRMVKECHDEQHLIDNDIPLGKHGNLYHIGCGVWTGKDGWEEFQKLMIEKGKKKYQSEPDGKEYLFNKVVNYFDEEDLNRWMIYIARGLPVSNDTLGYGNELMNEIIEFKTSMIKKYESKLIQEAIKEEVKVVERMNKRKQKKHRNPMLHLKPKKKR